MVNKASVVKTDVMASNGVIHVIDAVLIPPKKKQTRGYSPAGSADPVGAKTRRMVVRGPSHQFFAP